MTTISMTFDDLYGRTEEHVHRVQRQMRSGRARVARISPVARFLRACVAPIASAIASRFCKFIDKRTTLLVDQVVWFEGLPSAIATKEVNDPSAERSEALASVIEAGQQDVMRLRRPVMALADDFTRSNPNSRVASSLRAQLEVLTELFEAMERARWAVLEYQADADIVAGRVTGPFKDADELFESLGI